MPMSRAEWLAKALADAPPLTDAQIAALRPLCQRMAAQIRNAAPASTQGPRHDTDERNIA